MKTIQLITKTVDTMREIGIPANLTIGTFTLTSYGSLHNWAGRGGDYNSSVVSFDLIFKPSHIQTLINMGVKINLDTAIMSQTSTKSLRFKSGREAIKQGDYAPYYYMGNPSNVQTGVIENWLQAKAECSPRVLEKLDQYCRDNHRDHLAIHNNSILQNACWIFKEKYSRFIDIESQYFNIKAIRKTAHGKPKSTLLPIQRRVLKLDK